VLLHFYKYQGTGNDFVVIDNRNQSFALENQALIAKLCDRRFGIGADGLMLLQNCPENTDFRMIYFNADGQQSSMCGNGGRCIVAFAKYLGIVQASTIFSAIDGLHTASIMQDIVSLKMNDVVEVKQEENYFFLNTGSPHYVEYVENVEKYPVFEKGKQIRNSQAYQPKGTNVNFVEEIAKDYIFVRTYERGVENETFSCGTGVTASAIAYYIRKQQQIANNAIKIKTLGGELLVKFEATENSYQQIYLTGEAKQVFGGTIEIVE
jgi:diaminopimelate epimerase